MVDDFIGDKGMWAMVELEGGEIRTLVQFHVGE